MESTTKPFDIRSVPIQAIVEPIKSTTNNINVGLPQGQNDLIIQRENTYNGKIYIKYMFTYFILF